MNEKSIHIHLTVVVPTDKDADFRALMNELVTRTKEESGTLVYEWYTTGADNTWQILERYADAQHGDLHVRGFAENYAARFFDLVDSCKAVVSDNATPYIREVLDGIAPLYISQQGGFNRY